MVDRIDERVYVPAGGERFQEQRNVFGTRTIDTKVSASDTNGGLCIFELTDVVKGGVARHFHHEQEEWFYVVEGEYMIEIGDERYRLGPGDSVLAPREVTHLWAHIGEGRGKLIAVLQPAGKMEAFFGELAKVGEDPQREVLGELFRSHGMEVVGPLWRSNDLRETPGHVPSLAAHVVRRRACLSGALTILDRGFIDRQRVEEQDACTS